MRTRHLGALPVPAIGYGAMVLSPGMYGEVDPEIAETALLGALEVGCSFIDTSDGYDAGENETLIGSFASGRRDQLTIATKFGFLIPPGEPVHHFKVNYSFGQLGVNCDPALVPGYCEASLRRLGTDHVDLYYPHFPDPEVPFADTIGAVADLVAEGKVSHIGVSNVTAAQLREAAAVHPIAAVQTQWSLWTPIDRELLAAATDLGVGVVAWGPLGTGMLAGPVADVGDSDFRRFLPRFSGEALQQNRDRFAPLRDLALDLGITASQLALAALLHENPHVVPIPGSRTPAHIRENAAAAEIELSASDLDRIHTILRDNAPVGEGALR
ncbi:MAG: aldo/keto reductase [Actinobacteria bacterium]|nr:aldo/keto reductase [Actinomycetota bacterium]